MQYIYSKIYLSILSYQFDLAASPAYPHQANNKSQEETTLIAIKAQQIQKQKTDHIFLEYEFIATSFLTLRKFMSFSTCRF